MRGSSERSGRRVVLALAAVAVIAVPLAVLAQPAPVCVAPPPNLVGWWPGDGTTADIIGGHPGAWLGTAAYTAGEVGQAFSLDGSSWVQVPDAFALNPTRAITIDAWIHFTGTSGTARIVDKVSVGGANGYLLDLLNTHARFLVGADAVVGTTTILAGTTYHIAGSYDGASMSVYVNGVLEGGPFVTSIPVPSNTLPLRIGADQNGGNVFTGWIDEVEIFNRGLSQTEIQAIVAAGTAGKCKPQPIPASSSPLLVLLALAVAAGAVFLLLRR